MRACIEGHNEGIDKVVGCFSFADVHDIALIEWRCDRRCVYVDQGTFII